MSPSNIAAHVESRIDFRGESRNAFLPIVITFEVRHTPVRPWPLIPGSNTE